MQGLRLHGKYAYLMHADGTPFFYLGDTAWDMFQHLSREEAEYYLSVRAKQGFTVVQCILFSGTEPLDYPNKYGRTAVKSPYDRLIPDTDGENSYWDFVDWCLGCGEKYGIYFALLPMWNNKYNDPENTLFTGYDPSYAYGKFLGERYRFRKNIIWMLGGDVEVKPHMACIFQGLADGIRAGEGSDDCRHLITFHPNGLSSSVKELQGDRDYIDFHSVQSGHSVQSYEPSRFFTDLLPTGKPYLDTEPHYEDHVANWAPNFRRWDETDIREGAYECVLAGACGHTYGNPLVCFFIYEPFAQYKYDYYLGDLKDTGWMDALQRGGAVCLRYLKELRLSRPYFEFRPAQELVLNSEDDLLFGRISAGRGENYAFIYTPYGREIQADCTQFDKPFIRAAWFNPRTGEEKEICYLSPRKAVFVPETRGKGQDWVLILDAGECNWREIGQLGG